MKQKKLTRRSAGALLAAAMLILSSPLRADESYPSRPIKLIVPFAAGGSADAVARVVSTELAQRMGQPVVIENRGGAGGNVGMAAAARSAADGYSIVLMADTVTVNPYLYKKISFDIAKDFTPIGLIAKYHVVLVVNAKSPLRTPADFIAAAKAHPGSMTFGSSGAGGSSHRVMEQFMSLTGTRLLHIPFQGGGPALTALLGGQIDAMFDVLGTSKPYIEAGQLRAIGVARSTRTPYLPSVPALSEQIPGMEHSGWYALGAPAGMPSARIERISRALAESMSAPAVRQLLVSTGYDIATDTSPGALARLIKQDLAFYGKLMPSLGLKPI